MTLIIILVVVVLLVVWCISIYNNLVKLRNNRENAFANIDVQLKQRHDIIPQLVATVQGAANFEKGTLTEVIQARAGIDNAKVDPSQLTEEQVAAYQKAQDNLGKALANTIKVTVERYPELTATQGFRDLQVQLEGTENRIAVERGKFNEAVQGYNTMLRRFPNSIIAGICGFDKKGYFTAPEGSDEPVQVEFNF